jgi:rfaE bifunctional protein nucleotidyltransferase chain/domain
MASNRASMSKAAPTSARGDRRNQKITLDPVCAASHAQAAGYVGTASGGIKLKNRLPKPLASKLLTLPAAKRWANRCRKTGLRIVATNGCFDLLHYGHVSYLARAKRLGDRLVVGLNSDRSVRALKGPGRPLTPAKQRAAVLAALACVDAVVIFPQTRADRFLAAVRPHIYVKGGDYRPDTLDPRERAVLRAAGSAIRILPYVRGVSTSALIRKIRATGR